MAKKDVQNRLKSKVFWVSILSALALLLRAFGVYELPEGAIDIIANIILAIATAFGVANNPTNKNGF
jgi:uncharacterized membrane protein